MPQRPSRYSYVGRTRLHGAPRLGGSEIFASARAWNLYAKFEEHKPTIQNSVHTQGEQSVLLTTLENEERERGATLRRTIADCIAFPDRPSFGALRRYGTAASPIATIGRFTTRCFRSLSGFILFEIQPNTCARWLGMHENRFPKRRASMSFGIGFACLQRVDCERTLAVITRSSMRSLSAAPKTS